MSIIKEKIYQTAINTLSSINLLCHSIHCGQSNFITNDYMVILASDDKVLAGQDIETITDKHYVSQYTSEEIDDILNNINDYEMG